MERCPKIPKTPKPNKLCPSTQHPHHSHAQQHTTGTPLQITKSEAHHLNTQIHQLQVLDTQTLTNPLILTHQIRAVNIPWPPIITTEPQTETQGHVALNVPTPSSLEEMYPQYTEINARPRKRTTHGNISRIELPQTQHSLVALVEGPPPSPQTKTPRSQRHSQRVTNQTKRNHNSISTSPIPLPQTTAITCLSDPTPTNHLATLSQDQQAKRARQTQDTLPGTRKRTRSQTESQQHTPLT
jgi:hypothetical protein